jgi:hypothetical protein
MPAPDETPDNVVPLFPAPSDTLGVVLKATETYRRACFEVVALRIDWLASGVACWPEALLTREHLLTQLRTLSDGVRRMGHDNPTVSTPEPPQGGAA